MTEKLTDRNITQRRYWPQYLGGMLTETAFILGLTLLAFLLALIAQAIWL